MADMPRHDSSPTDSVPIAEREFVLLLISLYRDCPELWNVKSKDYLNKIKRSNAIQKILKVLRIYKPHYNEDMFKRKINTLRTNFNKEWHKIDTKKKSGASADEIPEPSLWYFHELTFIKDQVEKTDSKSSEGSLTEVSSRPSTADNSIPLKKKKQSASSITDELIDLASPYFKNPVNESDILAKGWAIKLNRLPQDQRRYAEKIINDTLFEAEMGTLTRNGVVFLSSSSSASSSMSPAPPVSASETCSNPASQSSYSSSASRLGLCENKNIKKQ